MATLFTPLSARYTLPSDVATMLRTTPPPEGIGVLENFFVRGSNLTNVFGSRPDSLYQTVPSGVTAIPYGLAPLPPGDGHSDRKSTRLNSSHGYISYAVFCLKKKKKTKQLIY